MEKVGTHSCFSRSSRNDSRGLLLETDEGLMIDSAMVKRVYIVVSTNNGNGMMLVGLTTSGGTTGDIPTRSDKTRRWLESGPIPTNVVEGPTKGTTLEELSKMVRDLQSRKPGELARVNCVTDYLRTTLGAYGMTVSAMSEETALISSRHRGMMSCTCRMAEYMRVKCGGPLR